MSQNIDQCVAGHYPAQTQLKNIRESLNALHEERLVPGSAWCPDCKAYVLLLENGKPARVGTQSCRECHCFLRAVTWREQAERLQRDLEEARATCVERGDELSEMEGRTATIEKWLTSLDQRIHARVSSLENSMTETLGRLNVLEGASRMLANGCQDESVRGPRSLDDRVAAALAALDAVEHAPARVWEGAVNELCNAVRRLR